MPLPPRRTALLVLAAGALLGTAVVTRTTGRADGGWRDATGGACTVRSHGGALAGEVLAACRAAVPRVRAFTRVDDVLVVVPRDSAELRRLAPEAGSTTDVAAVATADRVVVDPDGWRELSAAGRVVVLAHETTHLALRAVTTRTTPLWLVEGVADLVGFRSSGLPPATAAEELAADVRAHRVPAALPSDAAFGGPQQAQAYAEAWLATDLLARRYGDERLLQAYAAAGREPVGRVLAGLGTSTAAFTRDWRAHVVRELAA